MKCLFLCLAAMAAVVSAPAAIITNIYNTGSAIIPDGNLSGWADTRTVSGNTGLTVESVTVTLNISGGWNGDLYGYLFHVDENSSSTSVVLLNRVGTGTYPTDGYGEAGLNNVTLIDTSPLTSIHNYGGSGSAASALGSRNYNSAGGTLNTTFDGLKVNGSWSLFLADISSGEISQVTGWTLTIETVPEPTTWALLGFGTILGGWHFTRRQKSA